MLQLVSGLRRLVVIGAPPLRRTSTRHADRRNGYVDQRNGRPLRRSLARISYRVARVLGASCLVLGPSSGPRSLVHGAAVAAFAERQRIRAQKTLVDQGRRTDLAPSPKDGNYTTPKTALNRRDQQIGTERDEDTEHRVDDVVVPADDGGKYDARGEGDKRGTGDRHRTRHRQRRG